MFYGVSQKNVPGILSFANSERDNFLTITLKLLWFAGSRIFAANVRLGDTFWTRETDVLHRVTVVRRGDVFEMFFNGRSLGTNLKSGTLSTNGVWVLGQEQDSLGGGFSLGHTFLGLICDFQLWSRGFDENELSRLWFDSSAVDKGDVFDNAPSYDFERKRH